MKSTCVQCGKQMDAIINEPDLKSRIPVCDNPECPNFALLAISMEKMSEHKMEGDSSEMD